jgi:hypothetical protein
MSVLDSKPLYMSQSVPRIHGVAGEPRHREID